MTLDSRVWVPATTLSCFCFYPRWCTGNSHMSWVMLLDGNHFEMAVVYFLTIHRARCSELAGVMGPDLDLFKVHENPSYPVSIQSRSHHTSHQYTVNIPSISRTGVGWNCHSLKWLVEH